MGKMGNVAFINSFVGEVRKTQKDFAAIRQKRAEKAQKDEMFSLQKKKYELDIKEKERTGAITPLDAKSMISEFKDYTSMLTNESKIQDVALDTAQSKNMNTQKKLGSIARQITPTLRIMTDVKGQKSSSMSFTPEKQKKVTEADKFNQGFTQAEAGEITFDELGKQFPSKRKAIKVQRISALPEKSQRLLEQIDGEIKADATAARKAGEISNPEDVISDFLSEIVENRAQAESAGHDVDQILDILGVTEQEVLDNQTEPQEGFLKKVSDSVSSLTILGSIKKAQSITGK